MKQLALELRSFFERLTASGGSAQVETTHIFRIDEVSVTSSGFVRELKDLAQRVCSVGIGKMELLEKFPTASRSKISIWRMWKMTD